MDITPIMEAEVEKNMEHEMETGFQKGAAMGRRGNKYQCYRPINP